MVLPSFQVLHSPCSSAQIYFTKLCRKNNPLEVIFLISRRFSVKLYVQISSDKYERKEQSAIPQQIEYNRIRF